MRLCTPLTTLCTLLVLLCASFGSSNNAEYDFAAHPRFICTPVPVDVDPSCFPNSGPGNTASSAGANARAGHQNQPQNAPPAGWWGASEEAKATILHLRESLVQQKETILDQRETIRELTAKLALCEGFGHATHKDHHQRVPHSQQASYVYDNSHYSNQQGHHGNGNSVLDSPQHPVTRVMDKHVTVGDSASSPEQSERILQALKERLENLQKRNSSMPYSNSLKELLQRKIDALEQQLHHHTAAFSDPRHHYDDHREHQDDHHDDHSHDDHNDDHSHDDHHGDHSHDDHHEDHSHDGHHDDHSHDDHHDDHGHDDHHDGHHSDGEDHSDHHDNSHHDDHHDNEADSGFITRTSFRGAGPRAGFQANKLETMLNQLHLSGPSRMKSPNDFLISFPMRTNYMYGRVKKTLLQEIFAFTLCLWIKPGMGPGLGTPFSYSAPGQSNEIVLIEWGNNPIELLIDDKSVTLPLSLTDGKWHHVCVTWSTRDGHWEAYQDGVQRGAGVNLSSWHSIKPGGVFILGQEQDTLGGRFDATQSFVGEMSEVQLWSHVLSSNDIESLSSCDSHLRGDVFTWTEAEVELHGGVTRHPYDPCH